MSFGAAYSMLLITRPAGEITRQVYILFSHRSSLVVYKLGLAEFDSE
jgi:hypothetical protein